jgi:hypothetical protein
LRSCQSLSYSRTSQHFLEPRGSLLYSQEPSACPHAEPDQSNPSYLRISLILSSYLYLGLPSGLFPSGVPTKILHVFLFSPYTLHTLLISSSWTSSFSLSLYLAKCASYEAPHYAVFPTFLPNILLNTLFSNNLSLCCSLNVRHKASHPYKTTGKITALR